MKSGKYKIGGQIILVPQEEIYPNPNQPRKRFDFDELESLAQSIRQNGIIQPIAVRVNSRGEYELISGERRLRASRLVGMAQIPCIIMEASDEKSALFALLENIQRSDLGFFEEAQAIEKLIDDFGMSRDEVCKKLGKAPPTISNKLRLLRLPEDIRLKICQENLTERHARALLRLSDENERLAALRVIIERGCNVAQAEAYIESVLQRAAVTPPRRRSTFIVKDVRLFLNTIRRSMGIMQRAGVDAACEREDTDEEIRLTIRIPRTGAAKTA